MPRKKQVEVVDETRNIGLALKELCKEKGLPESIVQEAMKEALKKAYFKFSDDYPDTVINVDFDLDTGAIRMVKVKNVVAEIEDDVFETDPEEAYEETGIHYNVGDVVETPINIDDFRRAAAMQAKSVFKQKLREAEKQLVIDKYADKVGDILSGTVEAVEEKHCIIKIDNGNTNAYLNKSKMLPGEKLNVNDKVIVYVEEVDKTASGAPIIVSRVHPRFITRLMEQEISEIAEGLVEIKNVSRQPGSRSKVAVYSKDPNVDASGACIGIHGLRIGRVLSQIGNEKIDVVNYNENPLLFVADALKPAIVVGVQVLDEENRACRAIVPDDQYSLAIGKEAQNVNLAVRLTNWKIDIKSVSDAEIHGYAYQNVEDLKFIENAKKNRATTTVKPVVSQPVVEETKVVEETPVTENVKAENKVETVVEEVKPVVTPVVEETKVVEEEIVVKPTKATRNSFSELEAALNASTTTDDKSAKKKTYKKVEEKEEEKVEVKKPSTPTNVLPVYTEEELRALQEEEEYEEATKYDDDDIDYDEFDSYYDDEN